MTGSYWILDIPVWHLNYGKITNSGTKYGKRDVEC